MSTVYTLNGKVLKNAANDKWLTKKEAPAGFVMNASNAGTSGDVAYWEGPNYPDGYDGNGVTLEVTINADITLGGSTGSLVIFYTQAAASTAGPAACQINATNNVIAAGVYSLTMGSSYTSAMGTYLSTKFGSADALTNGLPHLSMRIIGL